MIGPCRRRRNALTNHTSADVAQTPHATQKEPVAVKLKRINIFNVKVSVRSATILGIGSLRFTATEAVGEGAGGQGVCCVSFGVRPMKALCPECVCVGGCVDVAGHRGCKGIPVLPTLLCDLHVCVGLRSNMCGTCVVGM